MSKEEFIEILEHAFDEGMPFIDYTQYYCFALIPKGDKWLQVSYDFMDHEILEKNEIDGEKAFAQLIEEIEKSLSAELEVFYLNKWREFREGLEGSGDEKLKKAIEELKNNGSVYGENLPIIFSKDGLDVIKSKL